MKYGEVSTKKSDLKNYITSTVASTVRLASDDNQIVVTNDNSTPAPTGVVITYFGAIAGIIGAVALMLTMKHRKHDAD